MEVLLQFDGNILLFIQQYLRLDWLTPLWIGITSLADEGWFWIALSLIFLIPKKTRKAGIAALLALLLNLLFTNVMLKNMVARTRPYEMVEGLRILIDPLKSFSFPSGHTACSFAAAFAYFRCMPRKKWGTVALVLAGLIGFSRLYVGVHYPTDVLGGVAVGMLAAWIASEIVETVNKRIQKKQRN